MYDGEKVVAGESRLNEIKELEEAALQFLSLPFSLRELEATDEEVQETDEASEAVR